MTKELLTLALEAPAPAPAKIDWQQKCLDKGFVYGRAPDDHWVECTQEQAADLLRDVIGVDVRFKDATTPQYDEVEEEMLHEENCRLRSHIKLLQHELKKPAPAPLSEAEIAEIVIKHWGHAWDAKAFMPIVREIERHVRGTK
jgi:hypothetical protein